MTDAASLARAANREDFLEVNAEGTRLLCEALVALPGASKPRLLLAGSLGASGPSLLGRPKVEEEPLQPVEWYGESKAEAERIGTRSTAGCDGLQKRQWTRQSPGNGSTTTNV